MQSSVTRGSLAGTQGVTEDGKAGGKSGRTLAAGFYSKNAGKLGGDFKWHSGIGRIVF